MKVVFATTNKRKISDLLNIIKENKFDIEVLTLKDIGFDEEIEENGTTIEENSLIKAQVIHDYCLSKGYNYPVITDDAGLFIKALDGKPGIYTARYADEERRLDPTLPPDECVNKVLRQMQNIKDRRAYYSCTVSCMYPDGTYFQQSASSQGTIGMEKTLPIVKPYFYTIFILEHTNKAFSLLSEEELKGTYRYVALEKTLKKIK